MTLKLTPILVSSLLLASTEWGSQDGNFEKGAVADLDHHLIRVLGR